MARAARGYRRVGDDRRRRAAGGRGTASPVAGRATGGPVGLGGTARVSASPRAMVGDARSGFARVLVRARAISPIFGGRATVVCSRRAHATGVSICSRRRGATRVAFGASGLRRRRESSECALLRETRVLGHELSATYCPSSFSAILIRRLPIARAAAAFPTPWPAAVWKSNLQPDFNVRVCDRFDARFSAVLRELDESNRFVQKSAESTSNWPR